MRKLLLQYMCLSLVINTPISFQMSVIFRLAYGRRVRTLQDDIVVANIKAGGGEYDYFLILVII